MADNVNNQIDGPKKKPIKKIVLAALVLALAVVAFFAYSYITKTFVFKDDSGKEPVATQVYSLDEFVINLKDNNNNRYLKTKIALGYEKKKDVEILIEKQLQIRDAIIQTLRSKTADEIMEVEKTDELKQELMKDLNKVFGSELVLDIYIVDFLIQ